MDLTDEDIAGIAGDSDVDPEELVELVRMAGIEPTGELATDLKVMAEALGLQVEHVLFGLYHEGSEWFTEQLRNASDWYGDGDA